MGNLLSESLPYLQIKFPCLLLSQNLTFSSHTPCVTAHVFAFSGFARLGHQQQLPAEGVLRERRVGYGGERTIPTMNSFQFTRFARLSLALRAPASGFLEGIDPFEETACRRARLKH